MSQKAVSLRKMTGDEFGPWRKMSIESYAHDLVRAMDRPLEAARVRAEAQFEEWLPDGVDTPGVHLLVVLDTQQQRVGTLWIGAHPTRQDHGFIYDIVINESARGQGFGAAAMLAAEDLLRQEGKVAVGLNVFGFNAGAERLYRSLGYEVVSTQMRKKLA